MKTKREPCCFCCNIVSTGNLIDTDILDLLKSLIVNLDTSVLENSTVCESCLNTITEICEYKSKNSANVLVQIKKEMDSEKPIMCQKCEKLCEQGETFPLLDCVTQVDWSDFVNYLFVDQDSQSLESLQICDSCRISVSNIQQFLKLIYIHDQSRMKYDIDNCDYIKSTGDTNLVEDKVGIKQEFKNFAIDDKTEIENVIEDNKTGILYDSKGDSDCISYFDFKYMNEEVDLKLEYDDADDNQTTDLYGKVDGKEMTSCGDSNVTSSNNGEEKQEVNCEGCNRLKLDMKVYNSIQSVKCGSCSEQNQKTHLSDLLKNSKSKGRIKSKIRKCDKCSYETTRNDHLTIHKLTHGIRREGLEKLKCQHCIYETYNKSHLTRHIKTHNNIRDFKCTFCSKDFTVKINLEDHLLKVHKNKDGVASKIHKCNTCSYETTKKKHLLIHNLKHGVKLEGLEIHKCQHCIYETYNKSNLSKHIKMHNNIRDFKCTLCLKKFAEKRHLDEHLLKVHESRYNVSSKIHE